MFKNFSRVGYSFANNASLSGTYAVLALTQDTTNSPQSTAFPNSCSIQCIEINLTSISATGLSVTAYLARDSLGRFPLTPDTTSGATQAITYSTAAIGGVAFVVERDF